MKIIITTSFTPTSRYGAAASALADAISGKLGGRVSVRFYDSGTRYDSSEELRAVGRGEVHLCIAGFSLAAESFPELRLLEVPFLFSDRDAASEALGGEVGEALFAGMNDAGIEVLGLLPEYRQVVSNDVRPLLLPSDFSELTLSSDGDLEARLIAAFGGVSAPVPSSETYAALQLGRIDGLFSAARSFVARQYCEVQSYATDCGNLTSRFAFVLAGNTFYDGLPEDVREAVDEAVRELADTMRRDTDGEDEAALARMIEDGCQAHVLTEAEREAWIEALEGVYTEYEELIGADLIALAENFEEY